MSETLIVLVTYLQRSHTLVLKKSCYDDDDDVQWFNVHLNAD